MKQKSVKKILQLLSQNEYVTSEKLAKEIQVSDRTVRKLIDELNDELRKNGLQIAAKQGKGFALKIIDKVKYDHLVSIDDIYVNYNDLDYEILLMLFKNNDYISTEEIAEKLYVSKQTVFLRINKLEKKIYRYNLKIKRKPGYGMIVAGKEINKRHCLVDMSITAKTADLNEIERCLKVCCMNENYHISDFAFQNLRDHIYVMIQRIRNNTLIEDDEIDKDISIEDYIQVMSKQLCLILEIQFNIKIPHNEVLYLSMQLSGKRYLVEGHNHVIDSDIMNLANAIIESIIEHFNLDLTGDFDLLISLCNHLMMLRRRLEMNVANKNPLLDEIMLKFPLAYSMAQQASIIIYQVFGHHINNDEIGYIALIIELSLEKKKFDISKKSILLVCSVGKSSAQLLKFKYMTTFKEYIKLIHTVSLQELGSFDIKSYDYVITTIDIPFPVPVPVIKVGHFLNDMEITRLRKTLNERRIKNIFKYFPDQLFIKKLSTNDKENTLKEICKNVEKVLNITDGLFESVWARETLANTAYGNLVALPHTNRIFTESTFVSVAILDQPIDWGGCDVQVIFLILIGNQEGYDLRYFYEVLSSLIFDKASIKTLIRKRDYDVLIELFQEKISEEKGE